MNLDNISGWFLIVVPFVLLLGAFKSGAIKAMSGWGSNIFMAIQYISILIGLRLVFLV